MYWMVYDWGFAETNMIDTFQIRIAKTDKVNLGMFRMVSETKN